MKITMNSQPKNTQCMMKQCTGEKGQHYLILDHHFPQESMTKSYYDLQDNQAIVTAIEANAHVLPSVQSPITHHMQNGEIVTIHKQSGDWLYVEVDKKEGWLHSETITLASLIQAREQLTGEHHHVVICEKCLQQLPWERFYIEEIEPQLHQHVENNYILSYLEMGATLEMEQEEKETEKVPLDLLIKRAIEEIQSGVHGDPVRLNQESIIQYYQTKRAK